MKHRAKNRKLGRKIGPRKALIKSLMNSFIEHEKIETTEAKAKELRPKIERLITKAKTDNLTTRRLLASKLTKEMTKKMIEEIGPKYKKREGGYTRIIKTIPRKGDGSKMAIIELV